VPSEGKTKRVRRPLPKNGMKVCSTRAYSWRRIEASPAVLIDAIAEKFIRYYWRQAMPYPAAVDTRMLQQNTRRQAAVLNLVRGGEPLWTNGRGWASGLICSAICEKIVWLGVFSGKKAREPLPSPS